ncbi:hypothetical protein CVD28_21725 [Bacillus sp. M6-12]|uniref:hypothetical protein n=1 Tax=Bacillus sp. M6-12 TaxID=2054166 RepID=UPI000C760147|nr:hypothetical protein [Bacillus sp. M6-12]PLS15636.1 hypothetical protein CVD28_21725 [Bacillus sp. M6-12]
MIKGMLLLPAFAILLAGFTGCSSGFYSSDQDGSTPETGVTSVENKLSQNGKAGPGMHSFRESALFPLPQADVYADDHTDSSNVINSRISDK